MARLVALCAGLACAVASAASASVVTDFDGDASDLAATAHQIGFAALTSYARAQRPAKEQAKGFANGFVAYFAKGPYANPVRATVTILVYGSTADAKLAFAHTCASCATRRRPPGFTSRSSPSSEGGAPALDFVSTCRNVNVRIALSGEAAKALAADADVIAGSVYRRAARKGMSACA